MFDLIALDADDTLWENEKLYNEVQDRFVALLADYAGRQQVEDQLYATEMGNLDRYGYGIKSFTLSMIETAVALSGGEIKGGQVAQILDFAKGMLAAEPQLLEGVREAVEALSRDYPLMLLTKGDLKDQESKLARSGLEHCFSLVEVVSDKSVASYAALLARHGVEPERFLMVGNSMRSDILPVLALGGHAIYIPYHLSWAHETVDEPLPDLDGFYELEEISRLPELVRRLVDR